MIRNVLYATVAGAALMPGAALAAEDFLAGIPRNQVLIAENPEGTVTDPSNFNVWVPKPNGTSTGLHQLAWTRCGTSIPSRA